VSKDGIDLPLRLKGEGAAEPKTTRVLELRERREVFSFCDIEEGAVPSLLRNFSAPVVVEYDYSPEQLRFLIQHDSNLFSRFEAVQRLVIATLRAMTEECSRGEESTIDVAVVEAFGAFFTDVTIDCAFAAEALTLPSESLILSTRDTVDYDAASKATESFKQTVAARYLDQIRARYDLLRQDGPYEFSPGAVGARALRNVCLSYMASLQNDSVALLALHQMKTATNMTDEEEALKVLCHFSGGASEEGIALFASKWRGDSLVMNKWFGAQASSRSETTLQRIRQLENDPSFDKTNPNKLRALYRRFTRNGPRFHDASGSGYRFIADKIIEIDSFNPQVAAGFAKEFSEFGRFDEKRRALAHVELQRVLAVKGLSADVFEIVSKTVSA
jgi:aminopeptidase N